MEIWRKIEGYENYSVSNLGRVKNDKTGKLFKLGAHVHGYDIVNLYSSSNGAKCCLVHRLVAEAFIPNPDNLSDVNHKNKIRNDNRVENLEWMSHKDNIQYSNARSVMVDGQHIFKSMRDAAKFIGCSVVSISTAFARNSFKVKGHIISYV